MTSAPALRVLAGALLAATALPCLGQAQQDARVRLVTPGSFADDSARLASITSDSSLAYSLLRSEEHTSELQSQSNLVCRLLLEKKKKKRKERSRQIQTYQ